MAKTRHFRLSGPVVVVTAALASLCAPLAAPAAAQVTTAETSWVNGTLAGMTLQEKVGQLFIANAAGTSVNDTTPAAVQANRAAYGVDNFAQLIAKYRLGGIIYFGANTVSPSQVLNLSNGIQQVSTGLPRHIPAQISGDQEGGLVARLGPPAAVFPGNMADGATRDTAVAYRDALIMGQEMRGVGINTDLAPVVDVNTNPLNPADGARAYSDETSIVSPMGAAQVRGFQSGGVAATAKHFPGLGDANGNTDLERVFSSRTLGQLQSIDLPPFDAAIHTGTQQVMTGHMVYSNVDPSGLPASLSSVITTGLLRNQLKFNGVVVTDSLQAIAVTTIGLSPAQIAVKAIQAGNDQLLETMPGSGVADLDAAYNGVIQAVQTGQISTTRLDQSVARILHEKYRLGLVANPYADPSQLSNTVGTPAHLAAAQQSAERSITMLKSAPGTLPLVANSGTKVFVGGWQLSSLPSVDTLAAGISARGLPTTKFPTAFHPTQDQINQAKAMAQQADVVIASVYNAWNGTPQPDQEFLVQALVSTGKPVIVIEQNAPYDVAYLPGIAGFFDVYSYQAVSLNAGVRALFGEINPSGQLPVTVTAPPPSTTVLFPFGSGLHY